MAVSETQYVVEGWGVGELWLRDEVVLAHEFRFGETDSARAGLRARLATGASASPSSGGVEPPAITLAAIPQREGDSSATISSQPPWPSFAESLVERVVGFLAGAEDTFHDIALDIDDCTPFERSVTDALRAVPRGEVVTYGELAALAGHPGAQRAVGSFCARNRFAFLVPCHRVVAAEGIGGYGRAGTRVKRRLLELEGAWP